MRRGYATIVEVGPRDGFQPIQAQICTDTKIDLIKKLYRAGIRRMEVTAFVSPAAVPQMADAPEVLAAAQALEGLDVQVLVANLRHAQRAFDAGARHIAFVLSVSEKHNRVNVHRSLMQSVEEYSAVIAARPSGTRVRLNLSTAFDCPFDGIISADAALAMLHQLVPIFPEAEVCPCDTTGRVTPDQVTNLFKQARRRFPQVRGWAFHGHDTYGLGIANVIAAWQAGINVIDASFAGLGGCPFAPGATGNVATEDVVWTFARMGIDCGVDLHRLIDAAREGAALPGAVQGGRVRNAITAQLRNEVDTNA